MPTPIVFIHGMFVTPRCWKPWIERFTAAGHDCLAPAWPLHDAAPEELRRRHPDAALGALGIPDLLADLTRVIAGCPRPPVLVGHSLGGLLVQLLLQKGLGAAGVAIDSAPPKGVVPFSWSFIRSNWPVVNPFVAESEPFLMSFEQFQYAFVHTLPEAAQREAYESQVVPESRKVGRGTLSDAAAIDFRLPHKPLLFIAGTEDHIIPASLNRSNHAKYTDPNSVHEYQEFAGRTHYIIGQDGWTEVADAVASFIGRHAP